MEKLSSKPIDVTRLRSIKVSVQESELYMKDNILFIKISYMQSFFRLSKVNSVGWVKNILALFENGNTF